MKKTRMTTFILIVCLILCTFDPLIQSEGQLASAQALAMSMTEVYADGNYGLTVQAGDTVTISSKRELEMLQKYIDAGMLTEGVTFSQTQDILASDYTFSYDEALQSTKIYQDGVFLCRVSYTGAVYGEMASKATATSFQASGVDETSMYAISTGSSEFCGTYEGNGYQIYGLWNVTKGKDNGLFAVIGASGCVQNVNMTNCYMQGVDCCGVIASQNNGTLHESNVSNSVIVGENIVGGFMGTSTGSVTKAVGRDNVVILSSDLNGYVGGIIGQITGGTCNTSSQYATCMESQNLGGEIYQYNYGNSINGYCGGIIGKAFEKVLAYDCLNTSNVVGSDVGGIIGVAGYGVKIINCINQAMLGARESLKDNIPYTYNAGGICGMMHGIDTYVLRCRNDGDIYALYMAGGMVGRNITNIVADCSNYGNVTVQNPVQETTTLKAAGGLIGLFEKGMHQDDGVVYNCANYGNVTGKGVISGGVIGSMFRDDGATGVTGTMKVYNCFSIGDISSNQEKAGVLAYGSLGKMEHCYSYDVKSDILPVAKYEGDMAVSNCYSITYGQLTETADNDTISQDATDYAYTYSLCQALNAWCTNMESEYTVTFTFGVESLKSYTLIPEKWELGDGGYPESSAKWAIEPSVPVPTANVTSSPTATSTASVLPSVDTPQTSSGPTDLLSPTVVLPSRSTLAKCKITAKYIYKKGVRLTWKRPNVILGYVIYRSTRENGGYQRIATVSAPKGSAASLPSTQSYVDKKVKKDRKYFYKIYVYAPDSIVSGDQLLGEVCSVLTYRYAAPKISIKRAKTAGAKRYLKIKLKKYQGKYVEIYMKTQKGGFKKLPLQSKKIKKCKGIFKLMYSKTGSKVTFKIRTFSGKGKKKDYSPYSVTKKIRL